MAKQYRKLIIFVIVAMLFLSGCGIFSKPIPVVNPSQKPQSSVDGLFSASQQLVGGEDDLSQLNLADVQIKTLSDQQVQLELTFMQGNASMNMDEYPSSGVPAYQLSYIEGIDRMVVRLQGLTYWTYRIYEEELNNPIVQGFFHRLPVDSDFSYLYIHTNDDYAYSVEEIENKLVITLNKIEEQQSQSFYVMMNAFDAYENKAFPLESTMAPSLCEDGKNIVLLSPPMQTKKDAEEYINTNAVLFDKAAPGKEAFIVQLGNNQLPTFNEEEMLKRLANSPLSEIDGLKKSFDPLTLNGRFLCWDELYTQYVYAKPFVFEGAQESDVYKYEQIWIGSSGSDYLLIERPFGSLDSALFSYRGDYVAFVNQEQNMRMLEIMSLKDGKIFVPAEESFGIDTKSFVWSNTSNILYAITGDYNSKQLMYYDLSDPNAVVVNGIIEEEFEDSDLAYHDGKIYYSKRESDSLLSEIYELDISSKVSKKIATGNRFELSPDGKLLLINDIEEKSDSELYRLYIYNIVNGESSIVYEGKNNVEDFTWSCNGDRVCYSVFINGWEAQFPYALYYYDVVQKKAVYMMDMVAFTLDTAAQNDSVLVTHLYTEQGRSIPVTYIVR